MKPNAASPSHERRSYGQAQIDLINAVIDYKLDEQNNGNPPSQNELADILGISPSTVRTLIDTIIANPKPSHPARLGKDHIGRVTVPDGEFRMIAKQRQSKQENTPTKQGENP
jgi:hypothetical protein